MAGLAMLFLLGCSTKPVTQPRPAATQPQTAASKPDVAAQSTALMNTKMVGKKAPQFACPLFSDKKQAVSLKDASEKGRVVVLYFFFPSCPVHAKELPDLMKIMDARAGKPVDFYLVFVGAEDDVAIRDYIDANNIRIPVLNDRYGSRIGESYGVVVDEMPTVPKTVVIGKDMVITGYWGGGKGLFTSNELTRIIDKLVSE